MANSDIEPGEDLSVENRVVIADDDPISLEMLHLLLESQGYTVFDAEDGEAAWELMLQTGARLIISDWEMPRLAGIDLARRVRNYAGGAYVYFILLTSREQSSDLVAALLAGADDFLRKPVEPAELIARLRVGERIQAFESRDFMLLALAKLAESRDNSLGNHIERMQGYVRLLSEQLRAQGSYGAEVDGYFVSNLCAVTPLHDIGKLGIPDTVLLKPTSLNNAEFELVKSHVQIGASVVDSALQRLPNAYYLQLAREVVMHHHERFDGSGYPDGLAGQAIPLSSRIVAVADAYDALTSQRVYRDANPHEVGRSILVHESGKQFDPEIISAFLAVESEFEAISKRERAVA